MTLHDLPMAVISFRVEAHVTQTVEIVAEDVTPENLVSGLSQGKYLTTLDHTKNGISEEVVTFDDEGNEVCVALIRTQETDTDGNFHDFEYVGDIREDEIDFDFKLSKYSIF